MPRSSPAAIIPKLLYALHLAHPCHPPPANQVSNELRDLLRRIFVQNPQQRITIPAILQHPWYLTQLPQEILSNYEKPGCMIRPFPGSIQPLEQIDKVL